MQLLQKFADILGLIKKKKKVESGIVKCKLLLTNNVELDRNSLASQVSTAGEDLLFTAAPPQIRSIHRTS